MYCLEWLYKGAKMVGPIFDSRSYIWAYHILLKLEESMPRVTPENVRDIIDTDLTDPRILTFITLSHVFTETHLSGKGVSEDVLTEIERWLAAHYISCLERPALKQKAGPVEEAYANVFGKMLMSSLYGQQAVALDPTGTLAEITFLRKTVKLIAISEQ